MSKNIRLILRDHFEKLAIKKAGIAEKSINDARKVQAFINGSSGIFGHQLIRILLAMGYKILAPDGKVILGNEPEKEIRDNFEDK